MEIVSLVIAAAAVIAAFGSYWLARMAVSQARKAFAQTEETLSKTRESVELARDTVSLPDVGRRESILDRRLERLMQVAPKVTELRWAAHAQPWYVGPTAHSNQKSPGTGANWNGDRTKRNRWNNHQ